LQRLTRSLASAALLAFLATIPAAGELTSGTPAPEFPQGALWLGTGGKPLTMTQLKGKVVLVDFWDYTCINCIRTFPHLKDWYARYRSAGLEIVGVHKGEFAFAADPKNVERAYARLKIPYPVLVDVNDKVWKAYDSNTWPNSFLIDRRGVIRVIHQGEGNYGTVETEIQKLLMQDHRELDFSRFMLPLDTPASGPECGEQSSEIFVGTARGSLWGGQIGNREGFQPGKVVDYAATLQRPKRGFFVQGQWQNNPDDFESVTGSRPDKKVLLGIPYMGRDVYAVLSRSSKSPVEIVVTHDGKPVPEGIRGKDVREDPSGQTVLMIDEPRMYYLITKEDDQKHELKLFPLAAGARVNSFAFGNLCLEEFDRL
jgi:peroxiredoxin